MSRYSRPPKGEWRKHLTSAEARELEELEVEARKLDRLRRQLTVQMNAIRNRATQRRRHRYLLKAAGEARA